MCRGEPRDRFGVGQPRAADDDDGAALRQRTRDLTERVKELDCLYAISSLMLRDGLSLAEIAQGTLAVIPLAWQFPADTAARIDIEGMAFTTTNYRDTPWQQSAILSIDGDAFGRVTVCYLNEKPESDEGPFLHEERRLIAAIAELLTQAVRTHRAQASLRASEAKYRSVVEQSHDGIILLSQAGIVTEWNRGQERIYGVSRTEAIGKSLWQIEADLAAHPRRLPNDERQWLAELAQAATETEADGAKAPREQRLTRRDGKQRVVQSLLFPVRSSPPGTGSPAAQVGAITRDVTESRLLEEEARRQAALRRAVVDAAPLAIVSLNAAAEVASWNSGATLIFGWESEEVIGKPDPTVPDERREEASLLWEHLLAGGSLMEAETQRRTRDGRLAAISYSAAPLWDSDGAVAGAVVIMADLTERKRMEDALRQAQQRQEALLQTAPMAVFRREAVGQHDTVWASEAVEALTGYPAARFRQETGFWLSRVYPGDRDGVLLEQLRAARRGSATYEYRWRTADDSYRRFVERAVLIAGEGEREAELLVTVVDATEARRRQDFRPARPMLRGQVAAAASNWRRIVVHFPATDAAPLDRPASCPHCGSHLLQRHQTTARRLAGRDGTVHVTRYRCTTCGRTFSNRPRGIDRRRQPGGLRGVVALLAALGMTGARTASLLAAAGVHLSRSTVWRIAREARALGLARAPEGVRCLSPGDETPTGSEFCVVERVEAAAAADGSAPLRIELLVWERRGVLFAWLRDAVETLGAALPDAG